MSLQFGRYRVIRRIGESPLKTVYLALDPSIQRRVILKVIRRRDAWAAPEKWQQVQTVLREEMRPVARLDHRSISVIYTLESTEEGQTFLAVEHVGERTLETFLSTEHCIRGAQLHRFMLDIAHGLRHAHEQGVIHENPSPRNLLITPTLEGKLTDFGFARWRRRIGWPPFYHPHRLYAAPEQVLQRDVGPWTDTYILAIVLWEITFGAHPFQAPTLEDTAQRLVSEPPGPIDPLWASALHVSPESLETFFHRALHRDPEKRYVDPVDLVRDFFAMLARHRDWQEREYPLTPLPRPSTVTAPDVSRPSMPMTPVPHTPAAPARQLQKTAFQWVPVVGTLMATIAAFTIAFFTTRTVRLSRTPAVIERVFPETPPLPAHPEPGPQLPAYATARLTLDSTPRARVRWNGTVVGTTPLTLDVTPGDHLLELRASGYESLRVVIHWPEGLRDLPLRFRLYRRLPGTVPAALLVQSQPSGAEVHIDGQQMGRTPLWIERLSPGRHTVRVIFDDTTVWEQSYRFERKHVYAIMARPPATGRQNAGE